MKYGLLLLLALFIVPAAGADPVTCETVLPSGSTETGGQMKVTLRSNTFWDTEHATYAPSIAAQADAFVEMPLELRRSTGLSAEDRARQLQWALAFANKLQILANAGAVPTHTVELTLNPCYYDFTSVGGHRDALSVHADLVKFLPKLVVNRNNLTILGLAHPTTLGYNGPSTEDCGKPGQRCHGRVLMVVPRGLQGIKLLRLTFEGSHDSSNFYVPERYLHENHSQLGDDRTRYGMLMIGYRPPAAAHAVNDTLVNGCVFRKVNFRAIELSVNARILGNRFEGVLPPPVGEPSPSYLQSLSCFSNPDPDPSSDSDFCSPFAGRADLYSASGVPFGMNWHSAISFRDFVLNSPPTVIESNTIEDFVEGIVGGSLPHGSDIRLNTIRRIADHGFYSLGFVRRGRIESNIFERILSQSIKLGGHGARKNPLDENAEWNTAAFETSISFNQFRLIGSSAILMAGTSNEIKGNVHHSLVDPSEWFNLTTSPFIWITTYGGNISKSVCGYLNHAAFNTIQGNDSHVPDIFIQQLDDPEGWPGCPVGVGDRSIEKNTVLDQKRAFTVYVRARSHTSYAPHNIQVSEGNKPEFNAHPPYCPPCARDHL